MSRRTSIGGIVLALGMLSTTSCALLPEERVETGLSDVELTEADVVELEPVVSAESADSPAALASGTDDDAQDLSWVPGEEVHGVRSIADVNPQWVTEPAAFDFVAPELYSGALVDGSDLYASGPVLMTFVSPSCAVSVEDGPSYSEAAEWNQTVTFVFVHTEGDQASFEQFVEDADLFHQNVIHINDEDLVLWNRFGIETQPSTMLVDRDGRASLASGGLGYEGLATAIALVRADA